MMILAVMIMIQHLSLAGDNCKILEIMMMSAQQGRWRPSVQIWSLLKRATDRPYLKVIHIQWPQMEKTFPISACPLTREVKLVPSFTWFYPEDWVSSVTVESCPGRFSCSLFVANVVWIVIWLSHLCSSLLEALTWLTMRGLCLQLSDSKYILPSPNISSPKHKLLPAA